MSAIANATCALALLASAGSAAARTIDGHVFVDADGDGVFSEGDRPLAGVLVAFDTEPFAATDATGRYEMQAPDRDGQVWVRTPDGFAPGPVWRDVAAGAAGATVDLALVPHSIAGPLTFVAMADSHIGKEEYGKGGTFGEDSFTRSLEQALDLDPPPAFFVIAGDITNRDTGAEVKEAAGALAQISVPFVPVPGNHDWVDKGNNYRKTFGPPAYSFDTGGVHFVVLNDNPRTDPDIQFLRRDLARVTDGRLVIAFVHRPPSDRIFAAIEAAGVGYLFTGHWHSNRYVRSGELLQINTEPIIRGGIDFTPAGYRVVTVEGRRLTITHRTVVEDAHVAITSPHPTRCVPPGPLSVIAAVNIGAAEREVRARLDDGAPVTLDRAGGWSYTGVTGEVASGEHRLTVEVGEHERAVDVRVCAEPLAPAALAPWPQLMGEPSHRGEATAPIEPPLATVWEVAVGANLLGGSPVFDGERVLVSLVDLEDGDSGGVVALDPRTGAERWRYVTGYSVRNAPASADGVVVVASNNGVVHAVDSATGSLRWRYDLGERVEDNRSAMLAAPTIDGGAVYAGVIGRFACLDLQTGDVRWQVTNAAPSMIDHASAGAAAVGGGFVIASFGLGGDGLVAWDALTGKQQWRFRKPGSTGINGAPVIDGDSVYVVNSSTETFRLALADGKPAWKRHVHTDGTPFSMASAGTPALAGGTLFVPTQYEGIAAVDTASGDVRWQSEVDVANVHVAHNKRFARSVSAAPVVTGDILWVGAADGVLRAIDVATGHAMWSADLGAPILTGPAPAGDLLFVASFDGTVRAMMHDPDGAPVSRGGPRAPISELWIGLFLAVIGGAALLALSRRG